MRARVEKRFVLGWNKSDATDISGYQPPCMLYVLNFFMVPLVNFNYDRFTTKIGFSASKLSFENRTTVRWFDTSFTNVECAAKDISVDMLST